MLIFNVENFIDGLEFEDLLPEDVLKMIPAVGIAKNIIRMLPSGKVIILVSTLNYPRKVYGRRNCSGVHEVS